MKFYRFCSKKSHPAESIFLDMTASYMAKDNFALMHLITAQLLSDNYNSDDIHLLRLILKTIRN